MENKNSFELTFRPLLTNSEIKKMEYYKKQLGNDFKDVYWSLSIPDIELIAREKIKPVRNEINSEIRNEIINRFKYKLNYIEKIHNENLAEIETTKPTGLTGERVVSYQNQRIATENERYNGELKRFNHFVDEMIKHNDLPEVIYKCDPFTTNTEAEKMIKQGYESVGIYDITDPEIKLPITKLYKFKRSGE